MLRYAVQFMNMCGLPQGNSGPPFYVWGRFVRTRTEPDRAGPLACSLVEGAAVLVLLQIGTLIGHSKADSLCLKRGRGSVWQAGLQTVLTSVSCELRLYLRGVLCGMQVCGIHRPRHLSGPPPPGDLPGGSARVTVTVTSFRTPRRRWLPSHQLTHQAGQSSSLHSAHSGALVR